MLAYCAARNATGQTLVAYTGLFLASDESAFITAVNLPVDGRATSKVAAVIGRD